MKSFSVKAIATSIVLVLLFSTSINAQSKAFNYSLTYTADIQGNNHSEMVSTAGSVKSGTIKFNPNAIADGILKVKMFNQPEGVYTVQLMDANGNVLGSKEINHSNSTMEIADFGKKFSGGTYQLVVINPNEQKTTQTVMLLM